jgi:hypothetical protein
MGLRVTRLSATSFGGHALLLTGALSISACWRLGYDEEVLQPWDAGNVSADGHDYGLDGSDDASSGARSDGGAGAGGAGGSGAGGGGGGGGEPLWESEWAYRKLLTIHASQLERAGVTLQDFPLLISLASDAELRADVDKVDGSDISFTLADGTPLLREVERFDAGTGDLIAWVRIPSLPLDSDTTIYLYYGNPSAAEPNSAAVWDSDFLAVHHMASTLDSTSYHNDATAVGDAHFGSQGAIGQSAVLDGDGDGYTLADIDELRGVSQLTISAWVRMDSFTQLEVVAGRTGDDGSGWGLTSGSNDGTDPEGPDDVVLSPGHALGGGGLIVLDLAQNRWRLHRVEKALGIGPQARHHIRRLRQYVRCVRKQTSEQERLSRPARPREHHRGKAARSRLERVFELPADAFHHEIPKLQL